MSRAVIAGGDEDGLGAAIESEGFDVTRIDGLADREALEDAGIDDADVYAITDVVQATSIPVARERNGTLRIVVYARDSLPEFARPLADLIVDPDLIGPGAVADAVAD
jgi:Trk K+ transport system NAD-binding subunit